LGQLSALQIDDPAVAELAREVGLEIPSLDRQRFLQARIFIYGDIAREIKLARTSESCFGRLLLKLAGVPHGGANFMAALSLLSYTEYAGRIKNNDFSDRNSRANFEDFFRDLGPAYESVMPTVDVYKVFRCGLAHEYYVKKDCTIAMRADNLEGAAIGYDGRRFFFVVENYFQDFRRAFDLLLDRSHGTT